VNVAPFSSLILFVFILSFLLLCFGLNMSQIDYATLSPVQL
jgi:hypothetical protein